jgi:hypothetical protein
MSDTTIIALVIIIGIFFLMFGAIFKGGIDGAVKIWSLLGVAFGAIISFYFTDKVKNREIAAVTAQAETKLAQLNDRVAATFAAVKADKLEYDSQVNKVLENVKPTSPQSKDLMRQFVDKRIDLNQSFDKALAEFKTDKKLPKDDTKLEF